MRWNWRTLLGLVVCITGCEPTPQASSTKIGGAIADNGGDIITCTASAENPFDGIYTLDYYATFDPQEGTRDDPEGSYEELLERLSRLVHDKLPELSSNFDGYLSLLESRDAAQARIWEGLISAPTDLKDEDIRGLIKDNCKETRGGVKVPNLHQMVDRRYRMDSDVPKVYYRYDYAKFQEMKRDLPLQAAYLVLHEWLWDFSDSAWVSRSVNRLLQSKSTEQMSPDAVRRAIRAYGITGDEGGYIGVPTQRTQRLQEIFSANPACDFSHRGLYEFFPETGREVFATGERRSYTLTVPTEATEVLGEKICGVALAFGYKAHTGSSASLDVVVQRGVGATPMRSFGGGSTPREALLAGTCDALDCLHKSGDLGLIHLPRGFAGSKWTIQVGNSGANESEMIVPYLLLVKMRTP